MSNKKYYGYDTMKEAVRKDFLAWYIERVREDCIFDLQKELFAYCDSDVDISRRGCLELRREFLEISIIDPFQYITLPSVCMSIFRANHLQPDTLVVSMLTMKISTQNLPFPGSTLSKPLKFNMP